MRDAGQDGPVAAAGDQQPVGPGKPAGDGHGIGPVQRQDDRRQPSGQRSIARLDRHDITLGSAGGQRRLGHQPGIAGQVTDAKVQAGADNQRDRCRKQGAGAV